MNPAAFTHEYLSGLKFKELQKLSVQHHVNKRWAKKQELIDNLLALKEDCNKEHTPDEKQDEDKEWKDGSVVFSDVKTNTNENEINRRLTFSVNRKCKEDPRSTFDIPPKVLLDKNVTVNSRETYDVAPSKLEFGIDPRATFEIPQKGNLITEENDSRATFVVPSKDLLKTDELPQINKENEVAKNVKKKTPENNVKNKKGKKSDEKPKSEIKMLTIPYARVTRRTRKDGEASKNDNSPIKLSKKSINIKKSVRLPANKSELMKSPMFSSLKKSVNRQALVQSGKITQSKIPTRLHFNEEKPKPVEKVPTTLDGNKENVKRVLHREKSRTADEVLVKKQNSLKVSFMSPPVSLRRNKRAVMPVKKTPLRKEMENKLQLNSTQTPGGKGIVTTKPITATKMPDFNKIHKKQFEQMDSLHDYLKKKEERTRKLFGTPQPGSQLKALNKSMPIFRFQSSVSEKENQGNESTRKLTTPFKRRENDSKAAQKEAFRSKLPPSKLQTDIKDKNRSHIHGVRTNKRFELQMKFRNM